MFAWWTNLCRRFRGVMAVEFGLILPLLFVVLVGIFEFGRYLNEYTVLEQSIRAGVAYAARYDDEANVGTTTEADAPTAIANMIKYGNPAGTGNLLLDGWSDATNTPEIKVTVYDRTSLAYAFTNSVGSYSGTAAALVIRIRVKVVYLPFVTGYMSRFGVMWMQSFHEQVWIGMG